MSDHISQRILVSGQVQGVGYRYFAQFSANRLQIAGRVRNLPDGRVEVVAQGSVAALETFQQELRRGPAFCEVADLEIMPLEPMPGLIGFNIIR